MNGTDPIKYGVKSYLTFKSILLSPFSGEATNIVPLILGWLDISLAIKPPIE
jgi:hypothetical protein